MDVQAVFSSPCRSPVLRPAPGSSLFSSRPLAEPYKCSISSRTSHLPKHEVARAVASRPAAACTKISGNMLADVLSRSYSSETSTNHGLSRPKIDPGHLSSQSSLVDQNPTVTSRGNYLKMQVEAALAVEVEGKTRQPSVLKRLRHSDVSCIAEQELSVSRLSSLAEDSGEGLWLAIREEARRDAEAEPALASYLSSTVLAHRSLESALAAHLANKMGSSTLLASHLLVLFRDVLLQSPSVGRAVRRDIVAARERDPACSSFLQCLLYFKGFAALQTHRLAHQLWIHNRRSLALALQARASEVFHVDIHPAASFGSGILLDHATGIVVGETAEVGDDVSMLHNVTLGGTGVLGCTRHPRIGSHVILGTGVTILGPVVVGSGAKVGAGSIVLSNVREGATVVGNPASEIRGSAPIGGFYTLDYII